MKSFVEFNRLAFASLGFYLVAFSVSAAEKPNIVFVFSDDHAT